MPTDLNAFRWTNWRVRGDEAALARTLDNMDAALPAGWSQQALVGELRYAVRLYKFRPEGAGFPWSVPIERWASGELQAGPVLAVPPPTWTGLRPQSLNPQLIRFLDEVIVPAATKAGATVYDPTPAERFLDELPIDLRYQFAAFDTQVRKALPFDWKESEAWDELVVAAYRSSAPMDDERLVDWFRSRGWPEADAAELTERLSDGRRLLGHYRDTLVIV